MIDIGVVTRETSELLGHAEHGYDETLMIEAGLVVYWCASTGAIHTPGLGPVRALRVVEHDLHWSERSSQY